MKNKSKHLKWWKSLSPKERWNYSINFIKLPDQLSDDNIKTIYLKQHGN